MSVGGLCQICEASEAVDKCPRCGTLACDRHVDDESGLCANCAAETSRGSGERDPGRGRSDHEDVQGEYEF